MNYDLLFALVFYGILYLLFLKYKSRFDVQGKIFVMLRTKIGLKAMDRLAKKIPRTLSILTYVGVFICFVGMGFILYFLVNGTLDLIFKPDIIPVLSPVIPGVEIPGLPIVMSFWHWILGILIIAAIHEFSHGVFARFAEIKIKSSGIAFLGPILAAFVEPDEKQMEKKTLKRQLGIMMAGPFSNFLTGILFFLIWLFILTPVVSNMYDFNGVQVIEISQDLPIAKSGLVVGDEIISVDGVLVGNVVEFSQSLDQKNPKDIITIETLEGIRNVELVEKDGKALMGIKVSYSQTKIKEGVNWLLAESCLWLRELFFWLYAISLGIGLFNLLPLGPLDGGKMFILVINKYIKSEKIGKYIIKTINWFLLILIMVNLLPFVWKLISWLFTGLLLIFGI